MASGHKNIWRPPAANMGFCDLKDVVAFGNNQLWRPPVAKFLLWAKENDYVICERSLGYWQKSRGGLAMLRSCLWHLEECKCYFGDQISTLRFKVINGKGLFTYYVIIFLKSQTEFCDRRSPQLVVAIGHDIFKVTGTPIRGRRPPQFIVPEGHKIL